MSEPIHLTRATLLLLLCTGLAACGSQTSAEATDETALSEEAAATESAAAETAPAAAPAPAPAPSKPAAKPAASKPAGSDPQLAAANTQPVCTDCGTITGIEKKTQEGEGTGVGALTGAVIGGVAGREIVKGDRDKRNIAGVVGAVAGGYAGHKIEEKARSSTYYLVSVRMEADERIETVTLESAEGWAVGDKVRIEDGKLVRR
jgi:outer membrane lipoprotein SlyB